MAMIISLIHPSRSRPEKSISNFDRWVDAYTKRNTFHYHIELIVSLDKDDPLLQEYIDGYKEVNRWFWQTKVIINNNKCVVDATNHAAKESKGDILIYFSDDFACPDNWEDLVLKEFEGVTEPMLLKVDDCLQKFDVPVLTIPIMNRALYERLGYFWHPEYKSMFVDEDLYWTAKKLGALKFAPHLKFPHEHVSVGKAQDDETYRNSAKNWEQGKAVFAKRKAAWFPV